MVAEYTSQQSVSIKQIHSPSPFQSLNPISHKKLGLAPLSSSPEKAANFHVHSSIYLHDSGMNKLRERIRVLMKSPDYSPLNKSEFARTLRLKPHERSELRAELLRLESKGLIVRGKKAASSSVPVQEIKAIKSTTKIDVTVSLEETIKTQATVLT